MPTHATPVKQRFVLIKKIFRFVGLYSPDGSNATKPQYIALRRFYRFLGLYPHIRAKHFYYETANSFMAPKIYEYTNMMRMTRL